MPLDSSSLNHELARATLAAIAKHASPPEQALVMPPTEVTHVIY